MMISVFLSAFWSPTAGVLAYLDPGTGSFLIQLLIGAIVGAALVVKTYWHRIKNFFARNNKTAGQDHDQDGKSVPENQQAGEDGN